MAYYNGGFPATYQPMYIPQIQPQTQPQNSSGITWVQGEAGAKSYLVAPNTTVQLWDSEAQVIYLKSADASGMPAMKVLDYTIRDSGNPAPQAATEYATREELDAVKDKLKALREEFRSKRKKEEDDDE